MVFLNPLLLFGLAAASIPVILHFFNLRKLRTIEFSTLSFLKELQKTKIRRLKIRQWILLALRVLTIILLVTAFSRPAFKGSVGSSSQVKSTMVIILDDSYSMTATNNQGDLLSQAKDVALNIVELLKEGDDIHFIRLSEAKPGASLELFPSHTDFLLVRNTIREIKPSYIHCNIENALRLSARLLANSQNISKEVFIISDFQSGLFPQTSANNNESLFAEHTRFFFVPLQATEVRNFSIHSAEIRNTIFEINKTFNVKALIRNHTQQNVRNHVVSVFLNGTRLAQNGIDIAASSSADVEFSIAPKSAGYQTGFVEIEDDALPFDNRFYFNLYVPEKTRILLVGQPEDLFYIHQALGTRQISDTSGFAIREVSVNQLSSSQIAASDVVLLANVRTLSSTQIDRLREFADQGGGLIFFPGNNIDSLAYANTYHSGLSLPLIKNIERFQVEANQSLPATSFEIVEFRHPLFEGMFEIADKKQNKKNETGYNIESPQLITLVRFTLSPKTLPIITLTNGAPFLIEQTMGNGKALLYATAAVPEWSNFPFKSLFVPLLVRSVSYLQQEPPQPFRYQPGDEVTWRIKSSTTGTIQVRNPLNVESFSNAVSSGLQRVIKYNETILPGIYTLNAGTNILTKFAVNINPDESILNIVEDDLMETMTNRIGIKSDKIKQISQTVNIQRTVAESRFGIELWKHFLIGALLLALIETFVARETKKEILQEQQTS